MRKVLVPVLASVLLLVGCTGQPASSDENGETHSLRWAVTSAPPGGWDPTMWTWDGYTPIQEAAYDSLIRSMSDGYAPGLATEWSWESPTEFRLELREGITFADGEALNGDVVKANLERFRDSANRVAGRLAPLEEVEVTSDSEVTLHLSRPIPDLEMLLSQNAGRMVSPAAIENPDLLQAEPAGVSPYLLDSASVTDVTYVFTKNPDYWDAESLPFTNLTVEVQEDRHSSFNALQVGQLDLIYGPAENVSAAEAAGLQVYGHPGTIIAMTVLDYQGKVVPELADARVRQAMNFAVDRQAIADNVLPGDPIFQMFPEESDAYVEELDGRYSYDPDQARTLLAEAGHADGLRLEVLVLPNLVPTATAVAGYLAEVGIELDVVSLPVQEFLDRVLSGNATMILTQNTINPTFVDVSALFSVPGARNPLNNEIPEVTELIGEVLYADPESQKEMYHRIATIASDEAISVPIVREVWFFMHNDNVNGLVLPTGYTLPTLRELVP